MYHKLEITGSPFLLRVPAHPPIPPVPRGKGDSRSCRYFQASSSIRFSSAASTKSLRPLKSMRLISSAKVSAVV